MAVKASTELCFDCKAFDTEGSFCASGVNPGTPNCDAKKSESNGQDDLRLRRIAELQAIANK